MGNDYFRRIPDLIFILLRAVVILLIHHLGLSFTT